MFLYFLKKEKTVYKEKKKRFFKHIDSKNVYREKDYH